MWLWYTIQVYPSSHHHRLIISYRPVSSSDWRLMITFDIQHRTIDKWGAARYAYSYIFIQFPLPLSIAWMKSKHTHTIFTHFVRSASCYFVVLRVITAFSNVCAIKRQTHAVLSSRNKYISLNHWILRYHIWRNSDLVATNASQFLSFSLFNAWKKIWIKLNWMIHWKFS